jgi:hypothetical protein
MCTWSGQTSAPWISMPFHSQSLRRICPISSLFSPKKAFLRYFGAKTMWYLQSRQVCAKLKLSIDMKAPFNQAALARSPIVQEPFLFGKAVSSFEPPDYRGVFTRGPLRGTLKQKTDAVRASVICLTRLLWAYRKFRRTSLRLVFLEPAQRRLRPEQRSEQLLAVLLQQFPQHTSL